MFEPLWTICKSFTNLNFEHFYSYFVAFQNAFVWVFFLYDLVTVFAIFLWKTVSTILFTHNERRHVIDVHVCLGNHHWVKTMKV